MKTIQPFDFPLKNVIVQFSDDDEEHLPSPILTRPHLEVNENDFLLKVKNVAEYRVQDGERVFVRPLNGIDKASVQLFLEGSVLGAILHQRGVLPFHGSSFEYKGKGVMICGNSGAGKSSITEAFCRNGARFVSDDITPVGVSGKETKMFPVKSRIKLWDDSLKMLKIENAGFDKIRPGLDKFYLPSREVISGEQRLDHMIVLRVHNEEKFEMHELSGMEKYNVLRKQIYRSIYLKGMPEKEKLYFKHMFQVASSVRITIVVRPQICNIFDAMEQIQKAIVS
ncbi:MAG: hypothetical protein IH595_07700 [Bacteroidales bacterium]|nr:hypothetical protein [Bacteroidales bacterium]